MWLIGRTTEQHTNERWQELRQLSTHFLDVVRGLPTLRAFNRAEADGRAARRGRRALSARDDGHAARRLPVRLRPRARRDARRGARRGHRRRAARRRLARARGGPDRARARARALPAAAPARRRVPRVRRRTRRRGAGCSSCSTPRPRPRPGGRRVPPSPAGAPVRLERRVVLVSVAPGASCSTASTSTLRPGELVALVGESGAGKSTVAALLLGFLQPVAGRVTVGGVDLASCDIAAWRRQVAWVPQRPALLRASVADNLRLGAPDAADDDVRRAAALAGADAVHRVAARPATTPSSATAGARCRRASADGSGSRARSCATRRS